MTPTSSPTIAALIPARAGSQRVPGKNTRLLGGKPLLAWTIEAALEAGFFSRVIVSSDSPETLRLVAAYDVLPMLRPEKYATAESPDVEWVQHTVRQLDNPPTALAILRPTSPFRDAQAMRDCWETFQRCPGADSIRTVQPVREHPYKMWRVSQNEHGLIVPMTPMSPLLANSTLDGIPYHSRPTQTLLRFYVQNASMEMLWTRTLVDKFSISGEAVVPFVYPTLDINTENDWREAERLACQMSLA